MVPGTDGVTSLAHINVSTKHKVILGKSSWRGKKKKKRKKKICF